MNQNRRAFLGTLGLFSILPGAGRVWRAVRAPAPLRLEAYWVESACVYRYRSPEYLALMEKLSAGHAIPSHLPAPGTHWRL